MCKKFFILILVLSCLSLFAQQTIKIKPIVGKHSFNLQSQEVGYGIKKHSLCLERIPDNPSDFFLPSDFNVEIDARPFNPPPHSGKLKINSQKTADGFLFLANAPQGNNLHFHLKKSASENSSYKIELNLTGGKKYQFKVDYVLNGYLLIMGETGNYYEMIDSLSANNYYLEALSLIDDELLKYQQDDQLNWWAEAIVGLFGDLVDVEAIGQTSFGASFYAYFYGCDYQQNSCEVTWVCGNLFFKTLLDGNSFLIINTQNSCFQTMQVAGNCASLCSKLAQDDPSVDYEKCMECCSGIIFSPGDVQTCLMSGGGQGGDEQCIEMCEVVYQLCRLGCPFFSDTRPICLQRCSENKQKCLAHCNR